MKINKWDWRGQSGAEWAMARGIAEQLYGAIHPYGFGFRVRITPTVCRKVFGHTPGIGCELRKLQWPVRVINHGGWYYVEGDTQEGLVNVLKTCPERFLQVA